MAKVNSFTKWFEGINKKFSAQVIFEKTFLTPNQIILLIHGAIDPNIDVVLLLMYKLGLTEEEKRELVDAMAELWDVPPKSVFDTLVNHLVEMTELANENFSDGPKLEIRS